MKKISIFFGILLLVSCYQQERNCTDFRTGKFKFEHEIEGEKKVTYFERKDSLEIENYEGKIDSSYVRWINDCEYILHKINPKNRHEQKGVHIKILTTTNNSYKFEFNLVGDSNKQQGTVIKLE
ncbi:MAG: DNA topoisomerase IV [Flavobacteriaceae bacterium]